MQFERQLLSNYWQIETPEIPIDAIKKQKEKTHVHGSLGEK